MPFLPVCIKMPAMRWITLLLTLATASLVAQSNGIPAKRPIFGGSCATCPWGIMGDGVRDAMKPAGYDVQVCYSCGGPSRSVRLVADGSKATPPASLTRGGAPTPDGRLDFGATGDELLQYAYLGLHDFAKDGPRTQIRLIANLLTPTYFLVAVDSKSGITDLHQIAEKKLPVRLVARGGVNEPINVAFLNYYGLSDEKITSFGGSAAGSYTRGADVDVVIGWAALFDAPEYAAWYDAPQQHDFTYLDIPADLRASLARTFLLQQHDAPLGLVRGVNRPIPTVARTGNAIYGRADMPDDFAYAVAKALDEHQDVWQWTIMPFTYDAKTVWKLGDIPLHPGAVKYYRERGYMQ